MDADINKIYPMIMLNEMPYYDISPMDAMKKHAIEQGELQADDDVYQAELDQLECYLDINEDGYLIPSDDDWRKLADLYDQWRGESYNEQLDAYADDEAHRRECGSWR